MGLLACMAYVTVIWWKASLNLIDAVILIVIYCAYLIVLQRMPPQGAEGIDDLERIPRTIVRSRRPVRIAAITGLFVLGGGLIYFTAEPFLGSLLASRLRSAFPTSCSCSGWRLSFPSFRRKSRPSTGRARWNALPWP